MCPLILTQHSLSDATLAVVVSMCLCMSTLPRDLRASLVQLATGRSDRSNRRGMSMNAAPSRTLSSKASLTLKRSDETRAWGVGLGGAPPQRKQHAAADLETRGFGDFNINPIASQTALLYRRPSASIAVVLGLKHTRFLPHTLSSGPINERYDD